MTRKKCDRWFLGIDLGTGSCKAVAINERLEVLGFGASDYTASTLHEKWQEQDPRSVLNGMIDTVRETLKNAGNLPGNCAGISIGGALHSLIALDSSGNPLTGVMTWADGRAIRQAGTLRNTPYARDLYRQTGCPVYGMYPLYKVLWLREKQPEIFKKTARFLSAKEYVFAQLTGHYVVDYCLAAGSGFLNTHHLTWNDQSLELAGISTQQLSSLCDPGKVFHGLNKEIAVRMGISPHTPLVLGSADAANSSLGAGGTFPWQATCMIGTSGALRTISSTPVIDAHSRSWCYAIDHEHWLVGGAINNGGIALSWLQDVLHHSFPDLPHAMQKSFDNLVALASQTEIGAGGVICLPFFTGERSPNWNLNARAVFFGLALHHRVEHLARAVMEGVAFRLKTVYDVLAEIKGDVRQMRASGGFTHSDAWLQIITNTLNRELLVPVWGETSCLGAAFWAMMGIDKHPSLNEIGNMVPIGKVYVPDRDAADAYERLYRLYTDLYKALNPFFERIVAFQNVNAR